MKKLGILFIYLFIYLLSSCSSNSDTINKGADIKYAKLKDKEFVFIDANHDINYSLSSLKNRVDIDLVGFDTTELDTSRLAQESRFIKDAKTYMTSRGSSLSFDLEGQHGFKVIKRKQGLVLAFGKNYTPVSDDELRRLEKTTARSIKIERDLESLESELNNGKTIVEAKVPEDEIRNLREEIKTDKKIDKELDDLSYEQDLIDDNMSENNIVSLVKLIRGARKSRLFVRGTKPFVYVKNDAQTKTYKVTFDFHNTYIPLKLSKVIEDIPSFGPIYKIAFYQAKWQNYKLAKLVFFLKTPIDLHVISVGNIVYIDIPNRVKASSYISSNRLARNMIPENNLRTYLGGTKRYYGKRVSVEVYDAKVSDVLRLLQKASKMNFVISDSVQSRISLSLVKVPWDQVLDTVLQNAQLGYVKEGNVIRIAPLSNLRDERLVASQAMEATTRLEPLTVLVYNASFVDPELLKNKIVALLSERGRMSIGADRILVVHDTQSSIFKIKSFLEAYRTAILGKRN